MVTLCHECTLEMSKCTCEEDDTSYKQYPESSYSMDDFLGKDLWGAVMKNFK